MKRIALLCFALAGGLQAMEDKEVDLEKENHVNDFLLTLYNEREAYYVHTLIGKGEKVAVKEHCPNKELTQKGKAIIKTLDAITKKAGGNPKTHHWRRELHQPPYPHTPALTYKFSCKKPLSFDEVRQVLKDNDTTNDIKVSSTDELALHAINAARREVSNRKGSQTVTF